MTSAELSAGGDGLAAAAWTSSDGTPQVLGFRPDRDPAVWPDQVRSALRTVLGAEPERVPLDLQIEDDRVVDGVRRIQFRIMTEPGMAMTGELLRPVDADGDVPVMLGLQGHTSGSYLSLGIAHTDADRMDLAGDRDYAVQALRRGWAALVFDQRGFGERRDDRPEHLRHGLEWRPCHHLTSVALLKGRTLLGERVWDVSRMIDALEAFEGIDRERIACIGDSTGGTVAYFAAAIDPRIALTIPTAYVCSFRYSLLQHDHCEDHYLPGFLNYFELGDLAALIAPRPIVVVTGAHDISFPIEGAEDAYERISEIYRWAGAEDSCRFVVGPDGHRFYADLAWPVIEELSGWKVSRG